MVNTASVSNSSVFAQGLIAAVCYFLSQKFILIDFLNKKKKKKESVAVQHFPHCSCLFECLNMATLAQPIACVWGGISCFGNLFAHNLSLIVLVM